jgi:aspartate/methionine/tyrosine aminotransferase
VKAATNLQSHATSNVANVSQAAAVAALTGDLSAVATMREAFDRRRHTIVSMLREIPGIACPEPQGAFYVYPSVKGLLGRPIAGRTAETSAELATLILEEAEVAVVPARPSAPPATCGCHMRWATTTWSRASPGCSDCSRLRVKGPRPPHPSQARGGPRDGA